MIGAKIKQLRKDNGLTQAELGKKLGVIKQTISSWENDISSPSNEALTTMSKIFGVTVDYLLSNNTKYIENNSDIYKSELEKKLFNISTQYEKSGMNDSIFENLKSIFPEIAIQNHLTIEDEKIFKVFIELNEDNRDIIIGEAKKLLKEQRYEDSVAAESSLREAK